MRRRSTQSLAAAATTVTPLGDEPADRLVEDVLVRRAAVRVVLAPLRDAHVHRLEQRPARVVRVALGGDPVEPADVPAEKAAAARRRGSSPPRGGRPGRRPTTPLPLSIAPTVPATWVPWPLDVAPRARVRWWSSCSRRPRSGPAAARSRCRRSPRRHRPAVDAVDLRDGASVVAPIRLTPVGIVWASASILSSATIIATDGSWLRAVTWLAIDARPSSRGGRCLNVRSDLNPMRLPWRSAARRGRCRTSGRRSSDPWGPSRSAAPAETRWGRRRGRRTVGSMPGPAAGVGIGTGGARRWGDGAASGSAVGAALRAGPSRLEQAWTAVARRGGGPGSTIGAGVAWPTHPARRRSRCRQWTGGGRRRRGRRGCGA